MRGKSALSDVFLWGVLASAPGIVGGDREKSYEHAKVLAGLDPNDGGDDDMDM